MMADTPDPHMDELPDLDLQAKEAAAAIGDRIPFKGDLAIILGSGLGGLVEEFRPSTNIPYGEIPHFPVSAVAGHEGALVWGKLAGREVLAMAGRVHYYEGHAMGRVTFPIRVMAVLGVKTLIITNAAGAVNQAYRPGQVVVIRDHINLMGDNPLRGTSNFIDLTRAYAPRLRETAAKAAGELDMELSMGVYLAMAGPCYETPAEILAARNLGADLVGMSTVPEVILANSLGLEVLGLSMVTNMAAGITGQPLSHEEVMETSAQGKSRFKQLVKKIALQIEG
jgi:purine-nucleoside phosphorylase